MPLAELRLAVGEAVPPGDVRPFLREAGRRVELFGDRGRAHAFVPSDYELAYGVLHALAAGPHLRGRRFCEWGCGFGAVAGLAALLDFESFGIEIEAELVAEARHLAEDFGLPIEFAHGSFVPRGAEARVLAGGTYDWLTTDGDYAYDELGLDPDEFDVVYAYPWPDEEAVTAALFERYAGPGAVLVTYHGGDGFRVRRKVGRRPRRR